MVKLRKAGYTRSVTSLYRMLIKLKIYNKAPIKKKIYEPKEYHQMTYPGQRVQVDVKYVPSKCLTKELKECLAESLVSDMVNILVQKNDKKVPIWTNGEMSVIKTALMAVILENKGNRAL